MENNIQSNQINLKLSSYLPDLPVIQLYVIAVCVWLQDVLLMKTECCRCLQFGQLRSNTVQLPHIFSRSVFKVLSAEVKKYFETRCGLRCASSSSVDWRGKVVPTDKHCKRPQSMMEVPVQKEWNCVCVCVHIKLCIHMNIKQI